uniref:HAL2 n=1 Tax=Candida albicans TaxID=5476 RepID=Q96VN9_CANAX|nr:HAL2 [Candida albicans]
MSHSTHPYQKELKVATLAVKCASLLTKQLSDSIVQTAKSGTLTKDDKSPVTIGDFASQAIINHAIKLNFPNDEIVGEEDSQELQENSNLADQVLQLITKIQQETAVYNDTLGTLTLTDKNEVYHSLDFGNSQGGLKGRFWALDPIDEFQTYWKTSCRYEHSGVVGGLYSAVKGVGSFYSELFKKGAEPLSQQKPIKSQNHTDPNQLKVVEGVEKGHSSHSTQAEIKAKLGFDPTTVAEQTINRLPVSDTYREKIWDHAAGNILIYESGGQVGDVTGAPLNFGNGRTLDSKGVIAANKEIFDKVIHAVTEVRKSSTPRNISSEKITSIEIPKHGKTLN